MKKSLLALGVLSAHSPPKAVAAIDVNFGALKKLTDNEHLALAVVHRIGQASGSDVIEATDEEIRPGSAHFILSRMEKRGLLTSSIRPKRGDGSGGDRIYTLTKTGLGVLNAANAMAKAALDAISA